MTAPVSSPAPSLVYPWAEPPAAGTMAEVAPGLFWARLPLPFRLNHVNVWLLEEAEGWTLIDTGCLTPQILALWEGLLAGPMGGRPVLRVVATHGHVDHIGLVGWMAERFGCPMVGTFAEWLWARVHHTHDFPRAETAHRAYLHHAGVAAEEAARIAANREEFMDLATPLPGALHEIRDGDTLRMGGRDWRVIVTGGHAQEHACFHDPVSNIVIAGDHLLPRISPVVAVLEFLPQADPLGEFLASFARFDAVAPDALVLPSHGSPYRGIRTRIAQLEEHHRQRLAATVENLRQPLSAIALARRMFPQVSAPADVGFALGETLAHVNRLMREGRVRDVSRDPAVGLYRAVQG